MRNVLLLFFLGAIAGAIGFYYIQGQRHRPAADASATKPVVEPAQPKPSLAEHARADAKAAKDAVTNKLSEWHLMPEDIRADLAQTGQIVRSKARAAGETIASVASSTRVVATIKAKYAMEKDLSARAIEVDCHEGHVILRGTAASPALLGKTVALALDTDGVLDVKSQIVVAPQSGD